MAIITSQTIVTIADASAVVTTVDITLQPENAGINARRELHYPSDLIAPIVYDKNPDRWTNFDTSPMVKRPRVGLLQTLTDNKLTGWMGYDRDAAITETWKGSDTEAPMRLAFFRQLYAYFESPPVTGFITWEPKDRTTTVYNIVIEAIGVGGNDVRFDYVPARQGFLTQDVRFRFRIIGVV